MPVDGRNREVHLHVVRLRGRPHAQLRLLGFKASLQTGLPVHVDLRHRPLPADRTQHTEQRRRERDQLPARPDQRGGKGNAGAGGDRPRQR